MSVQLLLLALALFIPAIITLVVSLATMAVVYKIHKWHMTCRRVEQSRDNKVEAIIQSQESQVIALRNIADRHEQMSLLLVSLTNEVLSLTQERIKRTSMPPGKDL